MKPKRILSLLVTLNLGAFTPVVLLAGTGSSTPSYTGQVLYALNPPVGDSFADPVNVVGGQTIGFGEFANTDPLLWAGTSTPVDLNPTGFGGSKVLGNSIGQQVGWASSAGNQHAVIWTGTAANVVDLNPVNFKASEAYGTNGSQQVGDGTGTPTGNNQQALLWNGSSGSVVILNPNGFATSMAVATNGTQQVGYGEGSSTGFNFNPILWTGTAASAVNLNPTNFLTTYALGLGGKQQVGYGMGAGNLTNGQEHALLWTGTAASAIDLNPSGFADSFGEATNGIEQVGYGEVTQAGGRTALLWSGTAQSEVNLQSLLPATGSWGTSQATSIDSNGNVFGFANGTFNGVSGNFAVEWSVPEPSSLSLLAIGGITLLRRAQENLGFTPKPASEVLRRPGSISRIIRVFGVPQTPAWEDLLARRGITRHI